MGFRSSHLLRTAVLAGLMLIICANQAVAQYNFGTLVDEIANRDHLAIHPSGLYSQLQASSYDRRSTSLGAPSSYANADTANFIRTAVINGQTEYVMMEDTGPGALTRWWMTGDNNTNGEIRVYIDGSTTPVWNGRFDDLSDSSPFGSSLAFQSRPGSASGHNLYAPIPYSQNILVTYRGTVNEQPGWNPPVYYNINYRKYDEAATVTSYNRSAPITHSAKLTATNQALANPGVSGSVTDTHVQSGQTLVAGQSLVQELTGGGAIRRLKVNVAGIDQAAALRSTYLELEFDGQRTARVPVGEFFGNGTSSDSQPYNSYQDFYRRVSETDGLTSYWTMPFQDVASVKLVNLGSAPVTIDLEVDSGNWTWDNNSMHFHADYRNENLIPTRGGNGTTDWTMLNVRGRGVYVGDTLAIQNRSNAWWGEGDEKIYVDYLDTNGVGNNSQPTHIGTGTEDYYGYAWGHVETFSRPFIAQPISNGNASTGVSVNSRVRGLDAIPFDGSFKFDMELWHWANTEVDLGGTTYWYGEQGAKSLRVAADLGADFRAGLDQGSGNVPDTAGDGQWLYMSASSANPLAPGAQTALLTFGNVGNAGNQGYGGGANGHNLAAISDDFLLVDGELNQGTQGRPGYHELALHPAGNVDSGSWAGQPERPYVVARWIAGDSSAGLANITGSIRNFVDDGDGVDFHIFVDGVEKFTAVSGTSTLPESNYDFDVVLLEGSTIDFVLGNGAANSLFGDESLLSAMIFTDYDEFLPIMGDTNGDGLINSVDWVAVRDNFNGDFSYLSLRAAYANGDLNGDLQNDEYDFALFKQAYERVHGPGSFATMQQVPEPAAHALVSVIVLLAISRRTIGGLGRAAKKCSPRGPTIWSVLRDPQEGRARFVDPNLACQPGLAQQLVDRVFEKRLLSGQFHRDLAGLDLLLPERPFIHHHGQAQTWFERCECLGQRVPLDFDVERFKQFGCHESRALLGLPACGPNFLAALVRLHDQFEPAWNMHRPQRQAIVSQRDHQGCTHREFIKLDCDWLASLQQRVRGGLFFDG